jgi:hypothetical protein
VIIKAMVEMFSFLHTTAEWKKHRPCFFGCSSMVTSNEPEFSPFTSHHIINDWK